MGKNGLKSCFGGNWDVNIIRVAIQDATDGDYTMTRYPISCDNVPATTEALVFNRKKTNLLSIIKSKIPVVGADSFHWFCVTQCKHAKVWRVKNSKKGTKYKAYPRNVQAREVLCEVFKDNKMEKTDSVFAVVPQKKRRR